MKYFSSNLEFLRKSRNMKQAEIQDSIGIERTTWSNYERNKSYPQLELFHKIAKFFGVNEFDLLNVDLSNVNLNEKKGSEKNSKNVNLNVNPSVNLNTQNVVNERKELYNTPLAGNVYDLDTKAAAGVPALVQNTDMLHKQPTLYIPHLGPGIHIRMKISGDSMHATIKDGDHVIATYQPEPLKTLREGHIYLMIDKDDGVVCKRVYNSAKNTLELESDNDIYKPYHRKLTDILSLFKVVEVHTTDLRNYYSDTRREINKIWQEIAKLKRKN
jgi:transcriptional regulator with XRE-family HTH domain